MSQSSFIKGLRWQRRHWYFIVWLAVIKRFEFCSSLSFSKSEPNSVWSQKVPTHLMVVKIWQSDNIQLLYCVAITRLVLPQPWESKKKVAILRKLLLSLFQWYSSSNPHVFNDSFFWKKSLWNLQKATSQWKVGIYSALNLKPIFSPKRPCFQCIGYIWDSKIWRYIYRAVIKSNLRAIKNYTLSYPTAQCIHCAVICNNSNLAVIDIGVSLYLEYFLNSFNGHTRCLRFLYHGLTFVWLRLASQNQSDNARLLWIKSNFHQIDVSLSFLLSLPSGC